MATKSQKKDKLSRFFAELDESDISDIEEDTEEQDSKPKPEDYIRKSEDKVSESKESLPPPEAVFENTKKPEFLKRKRDIDWDEAATSNITEKVDLSNTHAVPPPANYDLLSEHLKPTLGGDSKHNKAEDGGECNSSKICFIGVKLI